VPVPFVLQPAEGVALFELAQTKLSSGEVAEGRAGTDLLFLDETGLFFLLCCVARQHSGSTGDVLRGSAGIHTGVWAPTQ